VHLCVGEGDLSVSWAIGFGSAIYAGVTVVVRERGGTNILVSRFCVYIVPVFLIINKLDTIFYYGGDLTVFFSS